MISLGKGGLGGKTPRRGFPPADEATRAANAALGEPLRGIPPEPLPKLDGVIHQATRLRIMAALHRNREASFTSLRDGLDLTDGNLASHAAKLEEAGYVASRRALAGLSFEVRYRITPEGSAAFVQYVRDLRTLLEEGPAPAPALAPGNAPERDREP